MLREATDEYDLPETRAPSKCEGEDPQTPRTPLNFSSADFVLQHIPGPRMPVHSVARTLEWLRMEDINRSKPQNPCLSLQRTVRMNDSELVDLRPDRTRQHTEACSDDDTASISGKDSVDLSDSSSQSSYEGEDSDPDDISAGHMSLECCNCCVSEGGYS